MRAKCKEEDYEVEEAEGHGGEGFPEPHPGGLAYAGPESDSLGPLRQGELTGKGAWRGGKVSPKKGGPGLDLPR